VIGGHEITFNITSPAGAEILRADINKAKGNSVPMSNMQIMKAVNQAYGYCNITLPPSVFREDFIDKVEVNSMLDVYIDDTLEFQGLLSRPTVTGQASMSSNSFKESVVLRGFDYGYLFKDTHKAYGQFTDKYIKAESESANKLATVFAEQRFVNEQIRSTYRILMESFKNINDGIEFEFVDGKKISDKFGLNGERLFIMPDSEAFFVKMPISIQFLQENMSIWDYILRIADKNFTEVYGDTFNAGDTISLGGNYIYTHAGNPSYSMVIRPKMFGSYWKENQKVTYDKKYYQYSAMKDPVQIYNYFVVGSNIGLSHVQEEALGKVIKDVDSIKDFGFKPYRANVHTVWGRQDVEGEFTTLTEELASWWKNSRHFIGGQLSGPYNKEAKIGKLALFQLPKKDTVYEAYIDQINIVADAQQHRLHTVTTVNRGRISSVSGGD
jgi:hypothetical protein